MRGQSGGRPLQCSQRGTRSDFSETTIMLYCRRLHTRLCVPGTETGRSSHLSPQRSAQAEHRVGAEWLVESSGFSCVISLQFTKLNFSSLVSAQRDSSARKHQTNPSVDSANPETPGCYISATDKLHRDQTEPEQLTL